MFRMFECPEAEFPLLQVFGRLSYLQHYRPCESITVFGLKKIQGEISQGTSTNESY